MTEPRRTDLPGDGRLSRVVRSPAVRWAAALVLGLGVWLLPQWWNAVEGFHLKLDALLLVVWTAGMAASVVFWRRRLGCPPSAEGLPPATWVLGGALALFALTTVIHFGRYYFIAWPGGLSSPRMLVRAGVFRFMVLSWAGVPLFLAARSRRYLGSLLLALLVAAQLLCAWSLLDKTDGFAVYSDDHPSFMFRLSEFWGSFP